MLELLNNEMSDIKKLLEVEKEFSLKVEVLDQKAITGFKASLTDSHNKNIENWILPDKLDDFKRIEELLLNKEYLDNQFKWKNKRRLIEFIAIVHHYSFFKPKVDRKLMQYYHYRQFISQLYGFGKTGLTETSTKYKPSVELSQAEFKWIESPK